MLLSSRQERVGASQPGDGGSWDQGCLGALMRSKGIRGRDTHPLSFGPWLPGCPISSRRTLQDTQELAPMQQNPMGPVGTTAGHSYSPIAKGWPWDGSLWPPLTPTAGPGGPGIPSLPGNPGGPSRSVWFIPNRPGSPGKPGTPGGPGGPGGPRGPWKRKREQGLSTSRHSWPVGQALTPTHPQALQVTSEARALHVNEGLGEKHKGDVRHHQPGSGYPSAASHDTRA